ncbi:MAG: alpha/beta fold hydrolase [Cyanobacteriota bacterium]|nr:alpha/beta fold hydrolase [Cyanobacteriota bacterium]
MPGSNARRRFAGVLASLLLVGSGRPSLAAEVLEVQLDGMAIPIDLRQLEQWSQAPERDSSELGVWLNLLDPRSRRNLAQLLQAPLLRDKSFGQQLLNSWTGEQLLGEVAQLLQPEGTSAQAASLLRQTLGELLQRERQVSTLQLLRALPATRVSLRLDGVIALAGQWRAQLERQRQALLALRRLGLPLRQSRPLQLSQSDSRPPVVMALPVPHRQSPLPLALWPSPGPRQGPWVLLMPGLGGDGDQLSWLAANLAQWGWPVVVVDHPGSDADALKASLDGQRPPPGAESLSERLADVEAVLQAQRHGGLPALQTPAAAPVVLMGHSLGGLTALLAAGWRPEPGLQQRCRKALNRLPLTNLSHLLQCQLPERPVQGSARGVAAAVAFNGFGSLLWPAGGPTQGAMPVLLVGGSLDLITPPLSEQLGLFNGQQHPRSRLVLLEGGSHFSALRVQRQEQALFQLDKELVGINPRQAQELLLQLTLEFLLGLKQPLLLSPQVRQQNGIVAHVLNAPMARRWQRQIKTRGADPAVPPAHQP